MKLEVILNDTTMTYDLTELWVKYSGVVNIGQKCKQVWNTIAVESESVDPFQCHLIGSGESWRLIEGQNRTECPKGLLSSKLVPCNGCLGRCVNIHAGRPKYYLRDPETPTLVNGEKVGQWGTEIKSGDLISFGNVKINVISE